MLSVRLAVSFPVEARNEKARRRLAELPHLVEDPKFWTPKRKRAAVAFIRTILDARGDRRRKAVRDA